MLSKAVEQVDKSSIHTSKQHGYATNTPVSRLFVNTHHL